MNKVIWRDGMRGKGKGEGEGQQAEKCGFFFFFLFICHQPFARLRHKMGPKNEGRRRKSSRKSNWKEFVPDKNGEVERRGNAKNGEENGRRDVRRMRGRINSI
jgi:hypothetical protein